MFLVNISPSLLGCRESSQAGCYERSSALWQEESGGNISSPCQHRVGILSVRKLGTIMLDVNHLASVTRNEAGSTSPG